MLFGRGEKCWDLGLGSSNHKTPLQLLRKNTKFTNILIRRWCLSEHSHTYFLSNNADESVEKWPHLSFLGGGSDLTHHPCTITEVMRGHYQGHVKDGLDSTSFKRLTEWGQLAFKRSKRTRHTKQPARTMSSFLPM